MILLFYTLCLLGPPAYSCQAEIYFHTSGRHLSYLLKIMLGGSAIASAASLRMSGWCPLGPGVLLTLSPLSLFATVPCV